VLVVLSNPDYRLDDLEEVRRLVRRHPWATLVTAGPDGLVASHYPVLVEEPGAPGGGESGSGESGSGPGLSLLTHIGRPDDIALGVRERELLVVVQGPHGYITPSWYPGGDVVPTWDHMTAHLHARAEVLSDEENLAVLARLVEVMEAPVERPRSLAQDPERVRRTARGTVGLRLRVHRVEALAKLSQDKPEAVRRSVLAGLRGDGPYASPALARELARTLDGTDA